MNSEFPDYFQLISNFKPSKIPHINGPQIIGTTPGRPFLFLIPVSGEPPIKFIVKDLPEELVLDRTLGIISGTILLSFLFSARWFIPIKFELEILKKSRRLKGLVNNK